MNKAGYFTSGGANLFYVYERPTTTDRRIGILFVHAADASRLGPHRMFVEAARRYRALGYPTLRFDLRGCGDSYGFQTQPGLTEDIKDVQEAVRHFQSLADLEGVILFGISRGSLLAFEAAGPSDLPIRGMILLSLPVSSSKAAWQSFLSTMTEYLCKLTDRQNLRRLLRGQIQFRRIAQTLVKALTTRQRYSTIKTQTITHKCPVLLIYGENDPIASSSMAHYTGLYCKHNQLCEYHLIHEANHSFFHYQWKQELLDLSEVWVARFFGKAPHG